MSAPATPLPTGVGRWVHGARPRTLPLAVMPVVVGTAVAATYADPARSWWAQISWWRVALALLVSLLLQIGVNYANDYSDGVRGTDADRVGPLRLTASGLVPPAQVKRAAFLCFGLAALAGLVIALTTSWWLLLAGALAILAAWFYTGGSKPYGYLGLGDLSVFVFFGLLAVGGTAYVAGSPPRFEWLSMLAAVPMGFLAVAVLVANNLRDRPKDATVGKHTTAVRLGDRRTRWLYCFLVVAAFALGTAVIGWPWLLLVLGVAVVLIAPVRQVLSGATGHALIPVLVATGRLQLVLGTALAVGLLAQSPW